MSSKHWFFCRKCCRLDLHVPSVLWVLAPLRSQRQPYVVLQTILVVSLVKHFTDNLWGFGWQLVPPMSLNSFHWVILASYHWTLISYPSRKEWNLLGLSSSYSGTSRIRYRMASLCKDLDYLHQLQPKLRRFPQRTHQQLLALVLEVASSPCLVSSRI